MCNLQVKVDIPTTHLHTLSYIVLEQLQQRKGKTVQNVPILCVTATLNICLLAGDARILACIIILLEVHIMHRAPYVEVACMYTCIRMLTSSLHFLLLRVA